MTVLENLKVGSWDALTKKPPRPLEHQNWGGMLYLFWSAKKCNMCPVCGKGPEHFWPTRQFRNSFCFVHRLSRAMRPLVRCGDNGPWRTASAAAVVGRRGDAIRSAERARKTREGNPGGDGGHFFARWIMALWLFRVFLKWVGFSIENLNPLLKSFFKLYNTVE